AIQVAPGEPPPGGVGDVDAIAAAANAGFGPNRDRAVIEDSIGGERWLGGARQIPGSRQCAEEKPTVPKGTGIGVERRAADAGAGPPGGAPRRTPPSRKVPPSVSNVAPPTPAPRTQTRRRTLSTIASMKAPSGRCVFNQTPYPVALRTPR